METHINEVVECEVVEAVDTYAARTQENEINS